MTKSKKNERGQGLVEYALILVLVSIVVIVVLALLGPTIGNVFSNVLTELDIGGGGSSPTSVPAPTSVPVPTADPYANSVGGPWYCGAQAAGCADVNFCSGKPSGTGVKTYATGSGWFMAGGSDTTTANINGGSSTLTSNSVCP